MGAGELLGAQNGFVGAEVPPALIQSADDVAAGGEHRRIHRAKGSFFGDLKNAAVTADDLPVGARYALVHASLPDSGEILHRELAGAKGLVDLVPHGRQRLLIGIVARAL